MARVLGILEAISKYRVLSTAAFTAISTGVYVYHRDTQRFPKMVQTFRTGNMQKPLQENQHEMTYFRRPHLEAKLKRILESTFSNEYYVIIGGVGSGKSRLLKQVIVEMMEEQGKAEKGAPIYVLTSQGINFIESLAKTVNFKFDEHIKLQNFMDFLLKIQNFPSKDQHHKLNRLLDAVEEAACLYACRYDRPVVLVIDGASYIHKHMPKALERLQEKAKFWADENLVKVVFAFNNLDTAEMMQENFSLWSRAAQPIHIGDLSDEEAKEFLIQGIRSKGSNPPPEDYINGVVNLVGGRMYHLLAFIYDWQHNIPYHITMEKLKEKERAKFQTVEKSPEALQFVQGLAKAPEKSIEAVKVQNLSPEVIPHLSRNAIICYGKKKGHLWVKFDSRLTETVVTEMTSDLK